MHGVSKSSIRHSEITYYTPVFNKSSLHDNDNSIMSPEKVMLWVKKWMHVPTVFNPRNL